MLFNSLEYAVFLPIVFLLYWFVFNKNLKLQNLFVVVVSYIFYGWWDWRFLFLIAFTSLCSYVSGLLIEKYREEPGKAKTVNVLNIVVNLLILGVFKYYDFFVTSFADLFLGGRTDGLLLKVILPVGISFYTFQALSYSIDVYRGKMEPTRDIIQFFAYVSFFPQLVAGPIGRQTCFPSLPSLGPLTMKRVWTECARSCGACSRRWWWPTIVRCMWIRCFHPIKRRAEARFSWPPYSLHSRFTVISLDIQTLRLARRNCSASS